MVPASSGICFPGEFISSDFKILIMNPQTLKDTINQIFSDARGILAMDESNPTCNKRFATNGISQTEEMRRKYRQLIVTTPGLNESIGGAILSDETIHQKIDSGQPMVEVLEEKGIVAGIKVDQSTINMPLFANEKITEGLDGLRERLSDYKQLGARFAKWRAVITIGEDKPTMECIQSNIHSLTLYAAFCQEADIVPIVEPEVLMDGNHSLQRCYEVTERVLKALFYQLSAYRVDLEGIILKPNMVLAGKDSSRNNSVEEVAEATFKCLLSAVPTTVPAIAFLSGGQSPGEASAHLSAIHKKYKDQLPWIVAFSFARAIQQPALESWGGEDANVEKAQKILYRRAKFNVDARKGKYSASMEAQE